MKRKMPQIRTVHNNNKKQYKALSTLRWKSWAVPTRL